MTIFQFYWKEYIEPTLQKILETKNNFDHIHCLGVVPIMHSRLPYSHAFVHKCIMQRLKGVSAMVAGVFQKYYSIFANTL